MKKRYNSPVIEIVEMDIRSSILEMSLYEGDNGTQGTDGKYNRGTSDKQKGDEFRCDWDNIWGDM
ncbi:MAG: hypothetical protein IKJ61_00920 [Bacteroidaceae bacterium]|nr:hypothetical protein [Bacteroidaceae bacterium]